MENQESYNQWISAVFSRSSSLYDQVGLALFDHFGRGLTEFAMLQGGWHVLDVACGRGAVSFSAAEFVGSRGSVIRIDLAEGMLHELNKTRNISNLKNVFTIQMDAEHLGFAEDSFDAVLCGFGVFFLPVFSAALQEMLWVLNPAGC